MRVYIFWAVFWLVIAFCYLVPGGFVFVAVGFILLLPLWLLIATIWSYIEAIRRLH